MICAMLSPLIMQGLCPPWQPCGQRLTCIHSHKPSVEKIKLPDFRILCTHDPWHTIVHMIQKIYWMCPPPPTLQLPRPLIWLIWLVAVYTYALARSNDLCLTSVNANMKHRHWHFQALTLQWNLQIRDTQRTVKICPEFWGGLISHIHY